MRNIYLVASIIVTMFLIAYLVALLVVVGGNAGKFILFTVIGVIVYQLIFTSLVVLYQRSKKDD